MIEPNESNPAGPWSHFIGRRWVAAAALIGVGLVFACLLMAGGDDEFMYQGRPYRAYLPELVMPGTSSTYLEAKRVIHEAGAQGLPTLRGIIHRGEPMHARWFIRWQSKFPARARAWLNQRIKPYAYQQELQGAFSAIELLGREAAPLADEMGRSFAEGDLARRAQMARALSRLGPAAVEPILPFLTDPDLRTRSLAAFVVHELGPQATNAISHLLAGLPGADANHRQLVAQTLGRMGAAVLPEVTVLLASTNAEIRLVAVQALSHLLPRARELTPELVGLLDDPSRDVRFETASLLVRWWNLPTEEWRRHFQKLPPDHPSHARYGRSLAAVESCEARLIEVLFEGLDLPDPKRQLEAATCLVQLNRANVGVVSTLESLHTKLNSAPWEMAGLTNLLQRAQQQLTNTTVSGAEEIPPRPDTAPAAQSPP